MTSLQLPDLTRQQVEKAYARWAPLYDFICGPIFVRGRHAAASAARRVGGRILEVGVGTGLSFDDYDLGTDVTGVDISAAMVAKAQARLSTGLYPHVRAVMVMDAHALHFPESSFDCVVAQFVITLVEDPERVLDECARVVKPGGEIILVNHLYSERGLGAAIERLAAKPSRRLGLRPEFPFARLMAWSDRHGGAELIERRAVEPFGLYTLVRFRRLGQLATRQSRAA